MDPITERWVDYKVLMSSIHIEWAVRKQVNGKHDFEGHTLPLPLSISVFSPTILHCFTMPFYNHAPPQQPRNVIKFPWTELSKIMSQNIKLPKPFTIEAKVNTGFISRIVYTFQKPKSYIS